MSPMFTPAAGQEGVVADLNAQVASLRRQVKEMAEQMARIETALASALAATTPTPTKPTSSGKESGGTK